MKTLEIDEMAAVSGGTCVEWPNGAYTCGTADTSYATAVNTVVETMLYLGYGTDQTGLDSFYSGREFGGPGSPGADADVPGTGFAGA